tara:strand:+ start:11021 stop:11212 length:192 start_codon:yes stop_codon:yes gene_type:complete
MSTFTIHRLVSKWETYENIEASTKEEALKLVREELYRDTEELDKVKQTIIEEIIEENKSCPVK